METIHWKTSSKTRVPMGRRCQERPEEDETPKMETEQVKDRLRWKGIIEKAKTLPEL